MPQRTTSDAPPIVLGPLEIRPAEYTVLVLGHRVALTVREFELLHALARSPDRVLRRTDLYDLVWGGPMGHRDRSVDVFVRKLRIKLAAQAPDWTFVHTHFAIGYRLCPERTPAAPRTADAAPH